MPARLLLPVFSIAVLIAVFPASSPTYSEPPSPAPASAEAVSQSSHIAASGDGLYYVDGVVRDRHVRLLIDSGANTTLFSRSDARRLGIAVDRLSYRHALQTAKGHTALAFAELPALTIAGQTYSNVRIAIVSGEGGVSLLGQDMIRRFHHVAIDDGVMTLT